MDSSSLTVEFQQLYQAGESLESDIQEHLNNWPLENGYPVDEEKLPQDLAARVEELRDRAHKWFNQLTMQVLPRTTFERSHSNLLLRRINAAIGARKYYDEYHQRWFSGTMDQKERVRHNIEISETLESAKEETAEVIKQALRLIRTASTSQLAINTESQTSRHIPNTAFILMWMDKSHPELVDVHQAVKEVFAEFQIEALRADEIQHQDRITDLILNKIAQSELLFADLTGERPNVYYEVGYAHALGKRPILYRRTGTALHFDLSIHNVPEYENVTQLRTLLRQRLEAITGRVPPGRDV